MEWVWTYLSVAGEGHGEAGGAAVHVLGRAVLIEAADELSLGRALGGGGSVQGLAGGGVASGGLGVGEQREAGGEDDGGDTHFGGVYGITDIKFVIGVVRASDASTNV
jgi:hypothetical protein